MGIIISSFPGCGKTYLTNTHGDKIKILDAWKVLSNVGEPTSDEGEYDYGLFVQAVMSVVHDYDIVFIPIDENVLKAFNKENIDYDLFYPSAERRGEFIENMVKKKMNSNGIMLLDRDFEKMVVKIDAMNEYNCYKHKMSKSGHFIGNDETIMRYINSLKPRKENEQKSSERMDESPRSGEDNEAHKEGNA